MELPQFHSSSRVRKKYLKALEQLSEQLNQTWTLVFPPDALLPLGTCERFFEPFAQFGVALYDTYAEELLGSNPSQEEYLQALNFDLKTLVCNQIYPYRENPIRTYQDAMDADARGELPDEWTVRMREAWHLFEHPRHSANDDRIRREFIDVYGFMPTLWGRLIDRIRKAISRRAIHWLSEHAEQAEAIEADKVSNLRRIPGSGESPGPCVSNPKGATEPKPDESSGNDAGPAANEEKGNGVAPVLEFPNRAAWLKTKLAERDWSKHDLQRHNGPEHRTTQEILNGLNVQEDVLRKVVTGLQSKPIHKGHNLPAFSESDLPND